MILPPERRRALTAKAQTYAGNVGQVLPYLETRGISSEVAAMFMLGSATDGDYQGRLTIPYVTPGGVVQIKYRCANLEHHKGFKHVDENCPKYLYEAGTNTHLFNAQILITTGELVVVTEGELDAVCVQAYCAVPSVAYPGVDTWQRNEHFRYCFEGVGEVIVVADGDQAGRDSARRVAESLGVSARVVSLPAGEDSNSFIATRGAGAYLERLQ